MDEWTGLKYIYTNDGNLENIKKKYIVNDTLKEYNFVGTNMLIYDDHVTRIKCNKGELGTCVFFKPQISPQNGLEFELNFENKNQIVKIIEENKILTKLFFEFDGKNIGNIENNLPVNVGLPYDENTFILNKEEKTFQDILHMPIKIPLTKAKELENDKRITFDGKSIRHNLIYLPDEYKYFSELIKYVCNIEKIICPEFEQEYYIYLSINNSYVDTNSSQRRGGWHIDGYQGLERIKSDGTKYSCDRQYLISNVLPTQYMDIQINFEKIIKYSQENGISFDNINIQNVIEYYASEHEKENKENVKNMSINKLYYLNPYMIHRAKVNQFEPVKRTFFRIIFSKYERNRLGDTCNPLIGPLYKMKIKNAKDLLEIVL